MAADLTRDLGFSEARREDVRIVVTELGTNIIKHASNGRLVLRPLDEGGSKGLEILAIDKGPGMASVSECLRDGFSTAGSPGTGLGAVGRLSSVFDVYSHPPSGTVLLAQLWSKTPPRAPVQVGALCLPMAHQSCCGDFWRLLPQPGRIALAVADGVGHGALAAHAAEEAVRVFEEKVDLAPAETIQAMQGPLKSTRGASVAVATLDFEKGILQYAAVGNIAGAIISAESTRGLISHSGTVGHELHRVQEFTYPWSRDSLLVMHSDGLRTRWNLEAYPGLRLRHPALIAGVLYQDFERGRDDVTVVALRQAAEK